MKLFKFLRQLIHEVTRPDDLPTHDVLECPICQRGHTADCTDYQNAGLPGMGDYTYEEFSKDCDRW